MDLTIEEEWKSMFPICAVFNHPLLLSSPSTKRILGPLLFNPVPSSLTHLFSSPSFLPNLSPPSFLNLRRFLLTSLIPPSISSSITSLIGHHQPHNDAASTLRFNRLQFLRCPNSNTIIVFFPTGSNSNDVGILILAVKGSGLDVQVDENDNIFTTKTGRSFQIFGIVVNPLTDLDTQFPTRLNNSPVAIGYLLAYTMYTVDWFIVKVSGLGSNSKTVSLVSVCNKVFRSCCIVHACWSPHLPQQSVVLLENGNLFLFDLEPCMKTNAHNLDVNIKGTKLRVSCNDWIGSKNHKWLSCEFSWHPRILIVGRSDAVFVVDFRLGECTVSCLVKINMFDMYSLNANEQFFALSKAGHDGFYIALASNNLLLLCDVRRPLFPVLQWFHGLDKPSFIDVMKLSDLRSQPMDDTYKWASESGFCIIMGSFWSCEFNVFCYGPSLPAPSHTMASKISEFHKSLYAWELPSNLLLSARECPCCSCLVREENLKDSLPRWIEKQQKKEIVLGFGILDKDLSALFNEPEEYGGFTLIRLMSSGTLEYQRYNASWESLKRFEEHHIESLQLSNHFLYSLVDQEYKFHRRFRYLNLDYLTSYLNGNLTEVLDSNMKRPYRGTIVSDESFSQESHEILCEKLKACGFDRFRTCPAIAVIFGDISLPSSVHEVALRKLWASLPLELLQLAFSSYSVSHGNQNMLHLDFLVVSSLIQLPPFFLRNPNNRSNKWSRKVRRNDECLVGPILPLPVLLVLHEFQCGSSIFEKEEEEREGGFSVEMKLGLQYDEVKRVAGEMAGSYSGSRILNDHVVTLSGDTDNTWIDSQKEKPYISCHPTAFNCSTINDEGNSLCTGDDIFNSLIFKVPKEKLVPDDNAGTIGQELFDGLCPVELKFDAHLLEFGSDELKAYSVLKRQLVKWEKGFDLYHDFSLLHIT